MRNALLFLWSLLLLTACKKKEKPIVTHYPQAYTIVYYSEQDSIKASGSLARRSAYFADGVPVTMTLNGMVADTFSPLTESYTWHFKGLKDAVFNFSTHGNTLVNMIKTTDMKSYQFANVPDTISIATWKNIKVNGPAMSQGDELKIQLYFSDDSKHEGSTNTNVYKFPDALLQEGMLTGKALCRVRWYGKSFSLQMDDGNQGGSMSCVSVIEKQVVLVP